MCGVWCAECGVPAPRHDLCCPGAAGLTSLRDGLADKETRDQAVKALTRYLKRSHDIEELELAKIWKALFYCMWQCA